MLEAISKERGDTCNIVSSVGQLIGIEILKLSKPCSKACH